MRWTSLILVLGLLSAAAASADNVAVTSNTPADVFLDGAAAGATPVTLTSISPGEHSVRVVERSSGKAQIYPLKGNVRKQQRDGQIAANFQPGQPKEMVLSEAPAAVAVPAGVAAPAAKPIQVASRRHYRRYSRTYYTDDDGVVYHRHHHNQKSRVRNVSLGVTGLGLITGSSFLTGAGLGGVIANESR